jgi:hypothetical protein
VVKPTRQIGGVVMGSRAKFSCAAVIAGALCVAFAAPGYAASDNQATREISAQRRPQLTIYPRYRTLPPNAKRYCESWLEREYRVSGPVVVPRMRCEWR